MFVCHFELDIHCLKFAIKGYSGMCKYIELVRKQSTPFRTNVCVQYDITTV